MLEYLGILGIGWGIKKSGDAAQAAANRTVRSATKAVKNAPAKLGQLLDEAERARGRTPLERDYSMCAHDDEVIEEDGPYVKVRCRKCKRTAKGCA